MGLGSILRGLLPGTASPSAAGMSPAGPSPAGPSRSPSSAGTSGSAAVARPSGSWRSLPPIQRSTGAAPLIAPNAPFKAGLAAARPAPIALAPLRHERGLQAPAGLVSGIATPVQRATDPVPGSVRRPAGSGRSGGGAVAAEAGAWGLSDTSITESPAWPAFGPGTGAATESLPLLSLPLLRAPAVAPAGGSAPARGTAGPAPDGGAVPSLVRATLAVPVRGGRVGSRPTVARHVESSGPPPAASAALAHGGEGPGGEGRAPATTSPAAAQPPPTAPVSPSEASVSSGVPAVSRSLDGARPNLGQSRRLRVGAAITPVSGIPLGLQRSTAAPGADGPGAGSHLPGLPPPARPGAVSTSAAAAGLPVARELAGTVAMGALGDARYGDAASDAGHAAAGHSDAGHAAAGHAATAHAGPAGGATEDGPAVPLRPLVAARSADAPLVGTLQPHSSPASPAVAIHVQSEAAGEPAEEEGSPAAALAALGRMDQSAGIGQPGPGFATAFGAPSALFPGAGASASGRASSPGPVGGSPSVARSMASPSAPGPGPAFGALARTSAAATGRMITRGGAPGASPMPAPALQRTMSWDPVNGMTTSGVPVRESAPVASTPESYPVAFAAASGPSTPAAAAGHPALPAIAPLVARSLDSSDAPSAAAVQREVTAAAAPTGETGGGGAPATGGAMPEAQLDDLARRLHDKIAARLSHDLLVERERSGSLIDRGW